MSADLIVTLSWWMILPLIVVGTALHFAYDWSGHNRIAAVFAAVNESYWEHIKLAAWPVAIAHSVMFAAGGHRFPAYLPAAAVALYTIPITMVGLIYIYKGVTGRNVLWVDIVAFVVVIVIAQATFVLLFEDLNPTTPTVVLAACFVAAMFGPLLRFTHRPPPEPDIFIDPLTNEYGLAAHPRDDEPRDN
jgi:hypothetical protein